MICYLKAEGSGQSQSKPEGLGTRRGSVQGQEKMVVPTQAENKFSLPLHFSSVQVLSLLDNGRQHR